MIFERIIPYISKAITQNIIPPTEPSTVFFGLTFGISLCFPKNTPVKYANVSVIHAAINTSTNTYFPTFSPLSSVIYLSFNSAEKQVNTYTVVVNTTQTDCVLTRSPVNTETNSIKNRNSTVSVVITPYLKKYMSSGAATDTARAGTDSTRFFRSPTHPSISHTPISDSSVANAAYTHVPESANTNIIAAASTDRKSTRLNSSHMSESRMPSSA